jgi:hypothetical protein
MDLSDEMISHPIHLHKLRKGHIAGVKGLHSGDLKKRWIVIDKKQLDSLDLAAVVFQEELTHCITKFTELSSDPLLLVAFRSVMLPTYHDGFVSSWPKTVFSRDIDWVRHINYKLSHPIELTFNLVYLKRLWFVRTGELITTPQETYRAAS